jgi:hypothetical protein
VVSSLAVGIFVPTLAAVIHAVAVVGIHVLARVLGPVVDSVVSGGAASMANFVP